MENERLLVDDSAQRGEEEPAEDGENNDELPLDEPEGSASEGSEDEDEDDDEEDQDLPGFLVDELEEDEEEEEEGGEGEQGEQEERKKKRKKRRRELVLEEEDYELLEENTGIRVERPKLHRRLKKARDAGGIAAAGDAQQTAAEQLEAELFGPGKYDGLQDDVDEDDDGAAGYHRGGDGTATTREPGVDRFESDKRRGATGGGGAVHRHTAAEQALDEDEFFDDDDDDGWIVHEYEEEEGGEAAAEDAARLRAARRRRRRAAVEGLPGVDPAALEEANEIFGDVDGLMALYESRKGGGREGGKSGERGSYLDEFGGDGGAGLDDGRDEEEGDEEDPYAGVSEADLSDEEAVAELRRNREERAARRKERESLRAVQHLEPAAISRNFLTKHDEKVRKGDLPEREQLLRGEEPLPAFDVEACAAWVWEELFGPFAPRSKTRYCVEDGLREVEGPPPAWLGTDSWPAQDMRGYTNDVSSHRGLYQGRFKDEDRDGYEAIRAWRRNDAAQAALKGSIAAVLKEVYQRHEEVPVVGMFRKELAGELLVLRETDVPHWGAQDTFREIQARNAAARQQGLPEEPYGFVGAVTAADRRIRRWDVLYAVVRLADRWLALQKRIAQAESSYQAALALATTEEDRAAVLSCLDALSGVKSFDGLEDVETKFKLVSFASGGGAATEEALAGLDLSANGGEDEEAGAAKAATTTTSTTKQLRQLRPQRQTMHQLGVRAGLSEAAVQLGLTPLQFAENLEEGLAIHEPLDPSVTPLQYAEQWVDPSVPARGDAESVLKSILAIATASLGAEPAVRSLIRQHYLREAVVSTAPTPAGETVLTPFHPLGLAKRYHRKPLSSFDGKDSFLRVLTAEKEGLITVSFGLQPVSVKDAENEPTGQETDGLEAYLSLLQGLYLSSGVSDESRAWNELRSSVLREAITTTVLPALEKEARARLSADATATAVEKASKRLWTHASRGPLLLKELNEQGFETGAVVEDPRIMAVVWGPSHEMPTSFAVLDAGGNLVDYLQCPQFSGAIPRPRTLTGQTYSIFEDPKKARDAIRFRDFVENHVPHALLIGLGHPEALSLKDDINKIFEQILDTKARILTTLETGSVLQFSVDESIAALWEKSRSAREELPSTAPLVRRAVALGRQALDPLAVLASLAGRDRELLALPLHPLQASISEELRWQGIEETLVTATAQIGVDINAAAATPWLAAPLAFVPGLGPRKARALLRAVARVGGVIHSRDQMLRELSGVLGKVVFRNAAPSLRVRASSRAAANLELELLDDTRIHVESYELATQMAMSAEPGVDAELAVESAMAQPADVANLELDVYDRHLQESEQEEIKKAHAAAQREAESKGLDPASVVPDPQPARSRLSTLIDIQFELIRPYGELRHPTEDLSGEQAFWVAVGEADEEWRTLKPGRKVEVKVRWVSSELVRCVLQELSGLDVTISSKHVSSKLAPEQVDCNNFFKVGDTVAAVVQEVDPKNRAISLATDSTSLNQEEKWEYKYCIEEPADKYYRVLTKEEKHAAIQEKRRTAVRPFIPRFIQHPLFENVSMADASDRVVSQAVGAAMIRPASRAPNRLYLTMHTPGGVVWHVEIRELGPTSQNLRLAPPLEISLTESKKYVYDDLDELAARFVDPISSMMKSLSRHRKWIGGGPPNGPAKGWEDSLSGVKGELAKQKHDNPKTVAYGLAADLANPGMFYIGRIIGTTPRRERFSVLPDGFYFRKETFGHVDALLHAFKRNPDYLERQEHQRRSQNQQTGGPSQQASASMQELQQHSMATQYGQQQPYGMQQPHVYAQQQQQQQQQQYPSAYYGGGVLPPAAAAAAAGPYGGPSQEYGSHGGGNPIAAAGGGGGGFDGAGWYAPGPEQYGGPVMPHQHVPPQYPPNGPPPSYAAGQYGGRR